MVSFVHGVVTPIHTYKDVGKGCAVIRKYAPIPNNPYSRKAMFTEKDDLALETRSCTHTHTHTQLTTFWTSNVQFYCSQKHFQQRKAYKKLCHDGVTIHVQYFITLVKQHNVKKYKHIQRYFSKTSKKKKNCSHFRHKQ